jgi:hypothetical protein
MCFDVWKNEHIGTKIGASFTAKSGEYLSQIFVLKYFILEAVSFF